MFVRSVVLHHSTSSSLFIFTLFSVCLSYSHAVPLSLFLSLSVLLSICLSLHHFMLVQEGLSHHASEQKLQLLSSFLHQVRHIIIRCCLGLNQAQTLSMCSRLCSSLTVIFCKHTYTNAFTGLDINPKTSCSCRLLLHVVLVMLILLYEQNMWSVC